MFGRLASHLDTDEKEKFIRDLLATTLPHIYAMEFRSLSHLLWGLGKARVDLSTDDLGHSVAEALVERVADVMVGARYTFSPWALAQLWCGLHASVYPWNRDFLHTVVDRTVAEMVRWDAQDMAKITVNLFEVLRSSRTSLTREQRASLADTISALIDDASDHHYTFYENIEGLLFAAVRMRLRMGKDLIARVHDKVLRIPVEIARRQGRTRVAGVLCWVTQLGYEPTAQEAQFWARLLLDDLGDRWTTDEFSWTVKALSACHSYRPTPGLKRKLRTMAGSVDPAAQHGAAKRILKACQAWGLRVLIARRQLDNSEG